jgi:hypothetical protein
MTMGVDTSAAAVARLAARHDRRSELIRVEEKTRILLKRTAATLRTLAAERDAALARAETAERERDAMRVALQSTAGIAAVPWMDHNAQRLRIWKDARAALTTPAQDARP